MWEAEAGREGPAPKDRPSRILTSRLAAEAQAGDQRVITRLVLALHIVEQATALADHHEEAAARMEILRVGLQVLGQVGDPLGEDGHLHFGAAGIAGLGRVFDNERRARSAVIDIG